MEHIPRRPIIAATDLPMDLQSADALLALAHEIADLEPCASADSWYFRKPSCDDAEAIAVAPAASLVLQTQWKGRALSSIDLIATAARTAHAIGPAHIAEQGLTSVLARKIPLQFGERDVRLSSERLTGCNFVVHEEKYSHYRTGVKPNIIAKYFTLMRIGRGCEDPPAMETAHDSAQTQNYLPAFERAIARLLGDEGGAVLCLAPLEATPSPCFGGGLGWLHVRYFIFQY